MLCTCFVCPSHFEIILPLIFPLMVLCGIFETYSLGQIFQGMKTLISQLSHGLSVLEKRPEHSQLIFMLLLIFYIQSNVTVYFYLFSAGVGRSGTFIVLDHLLQLIREKDEVDIFSMVYKLRKERVLMVQTEVRFYFLSVCWKAWRELSWKTKESCDVQALIVLWYHLIVLSPFLPPCSSVSVCIGV